jgi:hypothetical protein
MAGSDETMRLVAELLDKTSGPLKDIQKSLKATADVAKNLHGDGAASVNDHNKAYSALHKSIAATRGEITGALAPAMGALGIATFGATGAVTALIDNLKKVGDSYNVIKDLTRRTGSTPDYLTAAANAIERLTGQDVDAAIQSLGNMREHMDRLTRLRPDELNKWNDAYTGLYESLGKKLVGKTLPEQLKTTMEWIDKHPEIQVDKKRDILELMGIDPRLATVKGEEFREALEEQLDFQKQHPFNFGLAKRLDESFSELKLSLRAIKEEINEAFGGKGASAISAFADALRGISEMIHQDVEDFRAFREMLSDLRKKLHIESGMEGVIPLPPPGTMQNPLKAGPEDHNSSAYRFGRGMLPMAFHGEGSSSQAEQVLANATKIGMLAAFREWFASVQGGSGYQPAALTSSAEGTGPGGFRSGGGFKLLPEGDAGSKSGGGGARGGPASPGEAPGGGGPTGLSGSAYLAAERARFGRELAANPALKQRLAAIIDLENPKAGVAVGESLMNRMNLAHRTIESGMAGGRNSFYSPGRHPGMIEGRMRELMNNPKRMAARMAQIDAELAGSNQTLGHTDQGSRGDPNYYSGGTGVNINGERFNDWGYPGARAYREHQQAMVARGDLLGNARAAGMTGGGPQKVEGDAHLKVDLNGFPKGTRTDLTYGGLFTEYTLSRGHQMEASEQK